jgi:hypothetical protein
MLQLVGPPASCCNQILTCATTVPTITNQWNFTQIRSIKLVSCNASSSW